MIKYLLSRSEQRCALLGAGRHGLYMYESGRHLHEYRYKHHHNMQDTYWVIDFLIGKQTLYRKRSNVFTKLGSHLLYTCLVDHDSLILLTSRICFVSYRFPSDYKFFERVNRWVLRRKTPTPTTATLILGLALFISGPDYSTHDRWKP